MTKIKDFEKNVELVEDYTMIDDVFMNFVLEEPECAEEVIRTILDKPDLKVTDVKKQYLASNLYGKESRLDIFAVDSNNKVYDIEVQRTDSGATPKRARYYSSILDTTLIDKGCAYEELPEIYCIFITENDIFKAGREYYTVDRIITELETPFRDGSHIVYFNLSIKGDSARAKLAADFFCKNPDKINSPVLRKRITYLKRTEKGKRYMLGTAERIRQEGMAEGFEQGLEQGLSQGLAQGRLENAVEIAMNMLRDNIDFMKVSLYSGLPLEQVKELAANL